MDNLIGIVLKICITSNIDLKRKEKGFCFSKKRKKKEEKENFRSKNKFSSKFSFNEIV